MGTKLVQNLHPEYRTLFIGEGFNLEEYNQIVSPLEDFKILKRFDVDWEKAELFQKNEARGMVDTALFRDKDQGNVFRNYYTVFVADGKWKVSLVKSKKSTYIPPDERVKCVWFYLYRGKLRKTELGVFKNLKEARKTMREIASFLSPDRLLYSEFEITFEDEDINTTRFKEVWCSKFVRDDRNGKILYTFVSAGAFFAGTD